MTGSDAHTILSRHPCVFSAPFCPILHAQHTYQATTRTVAQRSDTNFSTPTNNEGDPRRSARTTKSSKPRRSGPNWTTPDQGHANPIQHRVLLSAAGLVVGWNLGELRGVRGEG